VFSEFHEQALLSVCTAGRATGDLWAHTRRPPYCRERATSMVKVEMLVRDRPLRMMAASLGPGLLSRNVD
jgi:hypothetical protein